MDKIDPRPFPILSNPLAKIALTRVANRAQAGKLWRRAGSGVLLWIVFCLFLALVQFSTPDLPDNDGFYHIKLAYMMRTEGLKPDFPWLPLSILNAREFYDHHFLFHAALMPFTFGDLRLGAKWAAVVFASLAFLSAWNLFKNQRLPYASLWALGMIAVSEAFIYRMSITRAQSLSLAILMVGLDWLLRKKYSRLGFLAFVYVWAYDAFPLLLVFAVIYVISAWLIDRQADLRPIGYVALGTVLGLVINPYFPHNIVFTYLHILPKLTGVTAISVGNEWYPYNTAQLLENSPFALFAFASGVLAIGFTPRRMDLRTAASFALACLFGLMLFQSRRFIEYLPAFSLVFAAFAWAPLLKAGDQGELEADAGRLFAGQKSARFSSTGLGSRLRQGLPALVLILVLIPGIWLTLTAARSSLRTSKPYSTYAGASAWLSANTEAGSRVFQTDWDDFPRLFYYNTHNTYLIGLDPTYMLIYDADLYHLWVDITQGHVEHPSTTIQKEFGAEYIMSDLRHKAFLERAAEDPGMMEVYRDEDSVLYQTISPGGQK
jgi:hypothetical protein